MLATIQVVDPIVLNCKLVECPETCCDNICVPQAICCNYDGAFGTTSPNKIVLLTIGLFSIVQIERSVQMMIPAYDFCIPDKECVCSADDPCELFKRIKFPTNEFFPPKLSDLDEDSNGRDCCSR